MFRRSLKKSLGFYQRAVAMAPHPDKVDRGGEDSFMLCDHAIAVADGVGEHFVKWGIDAGIYARSLTREAYDVAMESSMMGQSCVAKEVVKVAEERSSGYRGTSTLTVASIGANTNVLQVANIGDSATMVLRKGKVVFKTTRQEHATNHPFQIGNGTASTYEDAETTDFTVYPNDIVISMSDGILDNLFDCQIEGLIKLAGNNEAMPAELAVLIPDDYEFPEDHHSNRSSGSGTSTSTNDEESDDSAMSPGSASSFQSSMQSFAHPAGGAALGEQSSSSSSHNNTPTIAAESWYDLMTIQQLNAATRTLVAAARENSLNTSTYTPFTRSMITNGFDGVGNKLDDCTVVLAQVLESTDDIRVDAADNEAVNNRYNKEGEGFMANQQDIAITIASGANEDALMPPDPYCGYP